MTATKNDASRMCLAAKDHAVVLTFPLPLLPPPPLPLCQNVSGSSNDENNNGGVSVGGDKDTGGNSGCVGDCTALFFCYAPPQRYSKIMANNGKVGIARKSFQDKPSYW